MIGGRILSNVLWWWQRNNRITPEVAAAQQALRKAMATGCTRDIGAAHRRAAQARLAGLASEPARSKPRRVTLTNAIIGR